MFIAMNRFKVALTPKGPSSKPSGRTASHLHKRPGLSASLVLRGPTRRRLTLFPHLRPGRAAPFRRLDGVGGVRRHRNAHKSSGPLMIGPNQFGVRRRLDLPAPRQPTAPERRRGRRRPRLPRPPRRRPRRRSGRNPTACSGAWPSPRPDDARGSPDCSTGTAHGGSAATRAVWAGELTDWRFLFLVHGRNRRVRDQDGASSGTSARGWFPAPGDTPLGSHLRADRCHAILVRRPAALRAAFLLDLVRRRRQRERCSRCFVARDRRATRRQPGRALRADQGAP